MIVNKIPNNFLEKIFWIQNQIQFNHWTENQSGWQHEVLGNYYKELNKYIDIFVEGVSATFGQSSISITEEMFKIYDDMDNLRLINEIDKMFVEFRKNFESEYGITKVLDDILELNNSTIYKIRLK